MTLTLSVRHTLAAVALASAAAGTLERDIPVGTTLTKRAHFRVDLDYHHN